jgi:tetratricopeptide (TPR) repeat protein
MWVSNPFIPIFRLVLLMKLLDDGNCLYQRGRFPEAAYRFEYAVKRIPAISVSAASPSLALDDAKCKLLLRLCRCLCKDGRYDECIKRSEETIEFVAVTKLASVPSIKAEVLLIRARAKFESPLADVSGAQSDVREALRFDPGNRELHELSNILRQSAKEDKKMSEKENVSI